MFSWRINALDMSQNITQDILFNRVLKELGRLNGVKTSLVASRDGFLLSRSTESDLEIYAKVSSSMLRIADAAIRKMGKKSSKSVVVDYSNERLIAARAGPKVLVAVLAGSDTKLDPVLMELNKAAEKLREII